MKEATKKGYAEAFEGDAINLEQPNSKTRRGRVGRQCAQTITTSPQQAVVIDEPKIEVLGNYSPSNHDASRIVSEYGLAPTVKEKHGTVTAVAMRGRYGNDGKTEQHIEISNREEANAITTVQKDSMVAIDAVNAMPDGTCRTIKNQYYKTSKANFERLSTFGATGATDGLRIRKLTPCECFKLQGFSVEDFKKAEAVCSNTQLYKQAGNSITVDVLCHLYQNLLKYWG